MVRYVYDVDVDVYGKGVASKSSSTRTEDPCRVNPI